MSHHRTPSALSSAPSPRSVVKLADPSTTLHRLLWGPTDSLASWATSAATAVIDLLPAGTHRAGYRHDVSRDAGGVVTHELVDLNSRLPVYIVDEQPDGHRIPDFCRPWPAELLRFITAILDGDLLSPADVESAEVLDLASR